MPPPPWFGERPYFLQDFFLHSSLTWKKTWVFCIRIEDVWDWLIASQSQSIWQAVKHWPILSLSPFNMATKHLTFYMSTKHLTFYMATKHLTFNTATKHLTFYMSPKHSTLYSLHWDFLGGKKQLHGKTADYQKKTPKRWKVIKKKKNNVLLSSSPQKGYEKEISKVKRYQKKSSSPQKRKDH